MDKRISSYWLDKYLKGDCSSAEEEQVVEWYNSFKDDPDWLSSVSETEKQEIKYRIYIAIVANAQGLVLPETPSSKIKVKYLFYAIGGIAAMLLIYWGVQFLPSSTPKTGSLATNTIIINNRTKRILEQTLGDGSHVWLSPGAQIKYDKVFTGNSREVTMTGESFFEVTKNPAKPFIINSGKIIIKVWGTSFRVRDSKTSSFADVTVVTGKVSVKIASSLIKINTVKEVMIYPNQQVTYEKEQNGLKTNEKVSIKELKIWQKINLSFDNTNLKQVITILNRNFQVNISATDEAIKDYTLNADFNGLNLAQIMEILHETLNITYEISGDNITLKRS